MISRRRRGRRPLRVLIAHASAELYGSDRQVLESAVGLRRDGMDVIVAVPVPGPLLDELRSVGIATQVVRTAVLRRGDLGLRRAPRVAARLALSLLAHVVALRRARPDLVYVNTVVVPTWLLAARILGMSSLCHVHEAAAGGKVVTRAVLSPLLFARCLIVNSSASADFVANAWPRLQARSVLVYNGVPMPRTDTDAAGRSTAGTAPLILVPGRLAPLKGQDLAIAALRLLHDRGVPARMVVAGDVFPGKQWYEAGLRRQAGDLGLSADVDFVGFVKDLSPLYASALVVLVPSRGESFGNVAVEAALHDKAVAASAVQGLVEIVDHERTGLLFADGSTTDMAHALQRLVLDQGLRDALGAQAGAQARRRFGVERYRQQVVAVARSTIGAGGRG